MAVARETLQIRTLTPLWSGSVTRECDSGLLETSILGSLRWWMEALARGYGVDIPEIGATSDSNGTLNCVDQVFGSTAQKRRFRLEVDSATVDVVGIRERLQLPHTRSSWYFPGGQALMGRDERPINLHLTAVDREPREARNCILILKGLLLFIARWGALGARTQHGFGIIQHESTDEERREAVYALRKRLGESAAQQGSSVLPSASRLFTLSIRAQRNAEISWEDDFTTTLGIRKKIRDAFRQTNERDFRHRVMGSVQGGTRQGSRVSISLPYPDQEGRAIRVWGWDDEPAIVSERIQEAGLGARPLIPNCAFGTPEYVDLLLSEVTK